MVPLDNARYHSRFLVPKPHKKWLKFVIINAIRTHIHAPVREHYFRSERDFCSTILQLECVLCRIERWVSRERERRPYLVRIPKVRRIQVVSNTLKRPVISLILTITTEKFLEQIFLIHSFKDVNAKMEFSSKLGLLHINGFVDLGSKFP